MHIPSHYQPSLQTTQPGTSRMNGYGSEPTFFDAGEKETRTHRDLEERRGREEKR